MRCPEWPVWQAPPDSVAIDVLVSVAHPAAFLRREVLARGVLWRGGRRLVAYTLLPEPAETAAARARPLLAAKFAAGDWYDITDPLTPTPHGDGFPTQRRAPVRT